MKKYKAICIILVLVLIAFVSATGVKRWSVNPENHAETIASLDEKIVTVLELTGGVSAASALISLLPDDDCTPIAQELAELAKYFLVVLSALYLEKYMLSLIGIVSFGFMIPLACLAWGIGYFGKKAIIRIVAYKLVFCALALTFIIPISTRASDLIYKNYETSIDATIENAHSLNVADEDEGFMNKLTEWVKSAATNALDYVTGILKDFIEALAIMIVTSCIIPILVIVLIVWMFKLLGDGGITRLTGEISEKEAAHD